MIAPTTSILDINVARITEDDLVTILVEAATRPPAQPAIIAYLNAHTANLTLRNPAFAQALRNADLVYADGMAVVRASQKTQQPLQERVNAGDFILRFLWACREKSIPIALLGSDRTTVARCHRHFEQLVPGIHIPFAHHGHFDSRHPICDDGRTLDDALAASGARVLLTGMGSPKQELWATAHAGRTGASVVWCVGALFEYFAGRARAPVWMRETGLEWLYRLVLEPRRLAGRYLVGNVLFLWRFHSWNHRHKAQRSRAAAPPGNS